MSSCKLFNTVALVLVFAVLKNVLFSREFSSYYRTLVVSTSSSSTITSSRSAEWTKQAIESYLAEHRRRQALRQAQRQARIDAACQHATRGGAWHRLCQQGLVHVMEDILDEENDKIKDEDRHVHLVQIGAHTGGFAQNDPAIGRGLVTWLQMLNETLRQNQVHWTFVEPSPPSYARLQANLVKRQESHSLCDLRALPVAVVSDNVTITAKNSTMKFYSISESIDPETGHDAKSDKWLPKYISQLSAFSLKPILFNKPQFKRRGLNVWDYIVETNVTAKRYSDLMQDILHPGKKKPPNQLPPVLVLIDTEGMDCDIILGLVRKSPYWPQFLIYEHKQCGNMQQNTTIYLQEMGYRSILLDSSNTLVVRNMTL